MLLKEQQQQQQKQTKTPPPKKNKKNPHQIKTKQTNKPHTLAYMHTVAGAHTCASTRAHKHAHSWAFNLRHQLTLGFSCAATPVGDNGRPTQ